MAYREFSRCMEIKMTFVEKMMVAFGLGMITACLCVSESTPTVVLVMLGSVGIALVVLGAARSLTER